MPRILTSLTLGVAYLRQSPDFYRETRVRASSPGVNYRGNKLSNMTCKASHRSSNVAVSNSAYPDIWTDNDIVTRDEVRRWLVSRMKLARDMHGDRIVDNALWLANKDYSAMRTAERVEKLTGRQ